MGLCKDVIYNNSTKREEEKEYISGKSLYIIEIFNLVLI